VVKLKLSATTAQFDVPRIFGVVYPKGIFCFFSSKAVLVTLAFTLTSFPLQTFITLFNINNNFKLQFFLFILTSTCIYDSNYTEKLEFDFL